MMDKMATTQTARTDRLKKSTLLSRLTTPLTTLTTSLMVGTFLVATPIPAMAKSNDEPLRFARGFSGNFLAARIASEDKDTVSAVQFFERALKRDPGNPLLIQQSFFLHLINGDVAKAVPMAEEILVYDASNDLARTVLGVIQLKEGNYGNAAKEFDGASGKTPLELLTNQLLAAWAEAGKDNLADALKRVDELEGPDWYESFRSFHGGLVAEHLGDADQAFDRVARAYEYDQTALRIVEGFARLQARKGSPEKGLAAVRSFKKQVPRHPYMDKVEADIKEKRRVTFTRTPREGASEVLFGLGSALGRDGGTELPKIYLQLSLFLNPKSDLAIMALVDIYNQDSQHTDAVSLVDQLEETSVFYEAARIESARNLAQVERVDEAIKRLTIAAREAKDPSQANLALANMLRFEKRWDEANEIYNIIIDGVETPGRRHWSLFYSRAITLERTERWEEAEVDFRQALELFPDQPLVLNYLGYTWVDKGLNLDEAVNMIAKAVEQRPEEGFILDSLGWAYFKLGRYPEAVIELEKAAEKMPADPLVHDHLGDAYWRVGRTLEARFQWSHARDLEPEKPEDLERILAKLKDGMSEPTPKQMAAAESGTVVDQSMDDGKAQRTHIVVEGENLWDIAQKYLGKGGAFLEILALNRDRLPKNGPLVSGTELRIPDSK